MKQVVNQSQPSPEILKRMTADAQRLIQNQNLQEGYPFDQSVNLRGFYQWLADTGLCDLTLINVGDPYKKDWDMLHTDYYEQADIDFLARSLGFAVPDNPETGLRAHWGVLTNGGTDSNMHGVYYGRKYLEDVAVQKGLDETHRKPILYVSEEAHYSVRKLGDILQIETRSIRAIPFERKVHLRGDKLPPQNYRPNGQMDVDDLRQKMDPTRPALIAIAIGGTFKGAIDDQKAIDEVVNDVNPPCVYRHLDAALFGGYLPWLDTEAEQEVLEADKLRQSPSVTRNAATIPDYLQPIGDILNQQKRGFDSIAVSGHKFIAMNEPLGIFVCRKEVLDHLHTYSVPYLNGVIPTISCSRSGFDCLKLYWRIMTTEPKGFRAETIHVLKMTHLLMDRLHEAGVPTFVNPYSTTVLIPKPSDAVVHRYAMACSEYPDLGSLAHVVVMQFFTEELIDQLAKDIANG